jgi:hypothetical protein
VSPSSEAEKRLGALLERQLHEPFVVYRSAAWLTKQPGEEPRDGEADLVVAHPELGIMTIEVKGGGIRRVHGQWESLDRNGIAHPHQGPVPPGHRRAVVIHSRPESARIAAISSCNVTAMRSPSLSKHSG